MSWQSVHGLHVQTVTLLVSPEYPLIITDYTCRRRRREGERETEREGEGETERERGIHNKGRKRNKEGKRNIKPYYNRTCSKTQ